MLCIRKSFEMLVVFLFRVLGKEDKWSNKGRFYKRLTSLVLIDTGIQSNQPLQIKEILSTSSWEKLPETNAANYRLVQANGWSSSNFFERVTFLSYRQTTLTVLKIEKKFKC